MDILGRALKEYYFDNSQHKLWVHDTHGPRVEMMVPIYFRSPEAMPDIEMLGLQLCKGKTLDIGAGAGSHSLWLQEHSIDVTAIDISEGAVEVMKNRGVGNVLSDDVFTLNHLKFDTLLLLMNGIGLVQNISGLRHFFQLAKRILNPGGQLLFDSSNVAYLYEDGLPSSLSYYGEVKCRYEYRKQKSDWFYWLYIDQNTLKIIAGEEGFIVEILLEDESDQYLARLTLKQ